MKQTKYIPSMGLAFFEEADMKKLEKYAKEGWILEKFAPLGYKLRKEKPQNIEYSLDYQKEADEDYYSYFEAAGWSHVCSVGNEINIFSAPVGTKPIYSDKVTNIEKYEREHKQMGKLALPLLIAFVIFLSLSMLSKYSWIPENIGTVSMILTTIALVILVFPGLPYISYYFKLKRMRKG